MDPKSAASTMIENGEISEGQREEQRELNPLPFRLYLSLSYDDPHVFDWNIFFSAVPEQKQSKPTEVLKIDNRFFKRYLI